MHARRYFVKALDAGDKRAALPIAAYKKLYEIEAEIRDAMPTTKLAERRARSKPIWDELVAWCERAQEARASVVEARHRAPLPHQPPGRARSLPRVRLLPLDNGIVERLHVRAALTRKNFLFAGADSGGERAAIAYTILGSCRLAGSTRSSTSPTCCRGSLAVSGSSICRRCCRRAGLPHVPLSRLSALPSSDSVAATERVAAPATAPGPPSRW